MMKYDDKLVMVTVANGNNWKSMKITSYNHIIRFMLKKIKLRIGIFMFQRDAFSFRLQSVQLQIS